MRAFSWRRSGAVHFPPLADYFARALSPDRACCLLYMNLSLAFSSYFNLLLNLMMLGASEALYCAASQPALALQPDSVGLTGICARLLSWRVIAPNVVVPSKRMECDKQVSPVKVDG